MKKGKLLIVAMAASVVALASSAAFAGSAPRIMNKCKVCHTWNKGGKNKIGPNLFGVVGRKAGSKAGYKYSGLKGADWVWDDKKINGWLTNPKKYIGKRTRMTIHVRKAADRKAAIDFLNTLH